LRVELAQLLLFDLFSLFPLLLPLLLFPLGLGFLLSLLLPDFELALP
jgi:hypothetical protein